MVEPDEKGEERDTADEKDREIFGWCMYDFANSAFATTCLTAVLPVYFSAVVVGKDNGIPILGRTVASDAFWAYFASAIAVLTLITAPILGAIADFSSNKKAFLTVFAVTGSLFTTLLFLAGPGDVWLAVLLYGIANFAFVSGNVFYDGFLPDIASSRDGEMDRVSSRGYAYGYFGGGVQLLLAILLIFAHDRLGMGKDTATRLAIASAGVWWFLFSIPTFLYLRNRPPAEDRPEGFEPTIRNYVGVGFRRIWRTLKRIRMFRHLVLFLVAFMVYNEGVQTVIRMAGIFAEAELDLGPAQVSGAILLVQFVAVAGALLFGWLGAKLGTKRTLLLSLVLWAAVTLFAYRMTTAAEFWILGAAAGLVIGGTQALSRSFYGSCIPEGAGAEFYAFYSVFTKFTAIWGPLAYGVMREVTGSSRLAILSIVGFFVVGFILLALVDVEKAREARNFHDF